MDPPEHILDLRARVRLRHTLVDQRGEWQHALLYHYGCPPDHGLGLLEYLRASVADEPKRRAWGFVLLRCLAA